VSYFYDDECDAIDLSDLKREAAAQRRAANAYCPECECHGYHATGCPEAAEVEDKEDEE
jgi:hypothetical protein